MPFSSAWAARGACRQAGTIKWYLQASAGHFSHAPAGSAQPAYTACCACRETCTMKEVVCTGRHTCHHAAVSVQVHGFAELCHHSMLNPQVSTGLPLEINLQQQCPDACS